MAADAIVDEDGHSARDHAELSPSTAHRWLRCTGCVAYARQIVREERTSVASERGTAMHELLDLCLKHKKRPRVFLGMSLNGLEVDDEMCEAVEVALAVLSPIIARAKSWRSEQRLAVPLTGEFGTVDFMAVLPLKGDRLWLHVRDFKSGRKPVVAELNPQMLLYADGALAKLGKAAALVDKITVGPIQPNAMGADTDETWTTTPTVLRAWGKATVAPAVAAIKAGKVRLVPGAWCHFCPAAGRCAAQTKAALEAARLDWADMIKPAATPLNLKMPPGLSNAQLAKIIPKLDILEAWTKAVRREAMAALVRDRDAIPGHKLVEGRSRRKWRDPTATMRALAALRLAPDTYAPRTLAGLTAVAKLIDKKKVEQFMDAHTIKPPGKPCLAPASDPRRPIQSNAALDFADDIDNPDE